LRQRVEKSRLANVRQANDAAFEAHGSRHWTGKAALMRGLQAKGKGAERVSMVVGHADQRTPTALISRSVEL
jgi:hypothetical protein